MRSESVAEIWSFSPAKFQPQTRAYRSALQRLVRARGWTLHEHETSFERPAGRPMFMVSAKDAYNLYRRLHHAKVGVLSLGDTFVCLEPRRSAVPNLALWQFVRHKAYWMGAVGWQAGQTGLPNRDAPQPATLDAFDTWAWPPACDGPTDPRILCMFVFLGTSSFGNLADKDKRVEFNARFGTRTRIDPRQRRWEQAQHLHAPLRLETLAPCQIGDGFHWDVAPSQHSAREIANTLEVWRIAEGGYVNVYPNAYLRGTRPHARRIWP